jgi:hypothetical protein
MVPADGSVMSKTLFSLKLLLDTRTRLSDFDPDHRYMLAIDHFVDKNCWNRSVSIWDRRYPK